MIGSKSREHWHEEEDKSGEQHFDSLGSTCPEKSKFIEPFICGRPMCSSDLIAAIKEAKYKSSEL